MRNTDIRSFAKSRGITLWMIADEMGISEPTMTRKFRKELDSDEKAKIRKIIKELEGKNLCRK